MESILLIFGFAGLIVGAQLAIKGALNISQHFKISPFFIGLTVLAIGSDLPELMVNISAAIHKLDGVDTSSLVIGGVIGTCMSQVVLALGVAGLFAKLRIKRQRLIRDGSMLLGSLALLFFVGYDGLISRTDGIVMLLVYGFYFFGLFREEGVFEKFKLAPKVYFGWSSMSLVAGFIILIFSSDLVIENSIAIAEVWGVSPFIIGVLILGFGTSLPEITLSLAGIRNGAIGLTVGNLIGSNIFDTLVTVGVGAGISEFNFERRILMEDLVILFVASAIVLAFFVRDRKLVRSEAVMLIIIYLFYIGLKLFSI